MNILRSHKMYNIFYFLFFNFWIKTSQALSLHLVNHKYNKFAYFKRPRLGQYVCVCVCVSIFSLL